MDPHYYGRYAMAGWILVATVLSAAYEGGSIAAWIADLKDPGQNVSELITPGRAMLGILLAAVIGIGAPPAVGFLLERVTSVLLWAPAAIGLPAGQMASYPDVKQFTCSTSSRNAAEDEPPKGAQYFHICFYNYAGSELKNWARRRRMQMYASFNAFLALGCGLVLVHWVLKPGLTPLSTYVVSVIFGVFLLVHGVREALYHRSAVCAWARALNGNLVIGSGAEEHKRLRSKLTRDRVEMEKGKSGED